MELLSVIVHGVALIALFIAGMAIFGATAEKKPENAQAAALTGIALILFACALKYIAGV